MQCPSHVGEHAPIDMSRLYSRGDISLKIRNQTGSIRVPAVGPVAQALEQLLQQKQITKGKRFIVAAWRHVASDGVPSARMRASRVAMRRAAASRK